MGLCGERGGEGSRQRERTDRQTDGRRGRERERERERECVCVCVCVHLEHMFWLVYWSLTSLSEEESRWQLIPEWPGLVVMGIIQNHRYWLALSLMTHGASPIREYGMLC